MSQSVWLFYHETTAGCGTWVYRIKLIDGLFTQMKNGSILIRANLEQAQMMAMQLPDIYQLVTIMDRP